MVRVKKVTWCYDTDGLNKEVKGYTYYNTTTGGGMYTDQCKTANLVYDYVCYGSKLYTFNTDCPGNCRDGKCAEDI